MDEHADAAAHRALAKQANGATWELLDGRVHTPEEADDLLQRCHAAAYHWARASNATPANIARACWLISRCHATLGEHAATGNRRASHGELALHFAQQCAHVVQADPDAMSDFDQAYAHEAMARALACVGNAAQALAERELALAVPIADANDRQQTHADIAQDPWFGLTHD